MKKRYRYRSEWADLLPYIVLPGSEKNSLKKVLCTALKNT